MGPEWLSLSKDFWPLFHRLLDVSIVVEDRVEVLHVAEVPHSWFDDLILRVSSWPKLLRVVTYLLKFLDIRLFFVTNSHNSAEPILFSDYCLKAQTVCIQLIQIRMCPKEISLLRNRESVSKGSTLIALNPFLDEKGILRVGGRLTNAPLEFN